MQLLTQIMRQYTPLTIQVRLMSILGNITQQQMSNEMSVLPSLFLNLFLLLRINSFMTDSKLNTVLW